MVKVLVYGYSHGITSSRVLERRCHDDIAFRFLTAQAAPDFVAIAWFRTRHRVMSYDRMVRAEGELAEQVAAPCRGLSHTGRLSGTVHNAIASAFLIG